MSATDPIIIGPERVASRDGTCCYCLEPIDIGDLVCTVSGYGWAHLDCINRELW